MKQVIFITTILCIMVGVASSEITMDWVTVSNAGNADDDTGYGAVGYEYQIGTYEVTAGQYTEFLNAVATWDTHRLYNRDMSALTRGCQIQRRGNYGSFTYSVAPDYANRPVNYVSWYDTLRFANWMHNGQPTGDQTALTTEDGAYDMSLGSNVIRKSDALVFLPSENEWYKAAFHKNDGVTANYFNSPTSSDNVLSNDLVLVTDPGNNATFYDDGYTLGSPYYRTEVGAHENSYSPYGTFDMGGNVSEWNETMVFGSSRGIRGGAYGTGEYNLGPFFRDADQPDEESASTGFRLASVPEPTIEISVDIKPQSCPNPVNVKSKGVLPVAILGSDVLDVDDIDINTILLEGVAPTQIRYKDETAPVADEQECGCHSKKKDGYLDLSLKFKTQDVIDTLGDVVDGETWMLHLTGNLKDGTPIEGADCIDIKKRGKK